jgi:predicted RNase H-like HicB family nuclease
MMERFVQLHIQKLPEGGFLATSTDVQGLVAQGRTLQETIEFARDVARKLIEAHSSNNPPPLAVPPASLDYPLIVSV